MTEPSPTVNGASTACVRSATLRGMPNQIGGYSRRLPSGWGMTGHPTALKKSGTMRFPSLAPQLAGIKYSRLEGNGLQWPVPDVDHSGTPTLHKDGYFYCGLGEFIPVDWTPPAEVPDEEYPFVLSTGRRLYHYHTRTQTGRAAGLNDLLGEETADISPSDADGLGH